MEVRGAAKSKLPSLPTGPLAWKEQIWLPAVAPTEHLNQKSPGHGLAQSCHMWLLLEASLDFGLRLRGTCRRWSDGMRHPRTVARRLGPHPLAVPLPGRPW